MKKQHAIVLSVVLAVVMVLALVALVACEKPQEKTAYGLVHGKGYVGKATVTRAGDSLVSADLNEACLPTYVQGETADGTYVVEGKYLNHGSVATGKFYKTVKFAGVTMTYDTTEVTSDENTLSKGYMVGTKTMLEFFADEANCEKYFEAVASNSVTVVTASGDKTDVLNAKALLKTENGYWGTPAENALGWKANVKATCDYVIANGFGGASAKDDFKKQDNSATNAKLDNELVDKNGVKTGATWTDMWDYFSLLKSAFEK